MAVSKTVEPANVAEAIQAGLTDVGENRVQEAQSKRPQVDALIAQPARWHMIGHLQTNKVKKALLVFDVFQAIDSLHLAQELDRRAAEMAKRIPALVEVNTSGEATKYGCQPEHLISLAAEIAKLKSLELRGLMTVGPGLSIEDPERSRPCFRLLRELRDRGEVELGLHLPWLSMGMSSDFAVAIEEGATILRIGAAIFGTRR